MNAKEAGEQAILSVQSEIDAINKKIEKAVSKGELSTSIGEVSEAAQRHFISIGYQFKIALKYGTAISDTYLKIIW